MTPWIAWLLRLLQLYVAMRVVSFVLVKLAAWFLRRRLGVSCSMGRISLLGVNDLHIVTRVTQRQELRLGLKKLSLSLAIGKAHPVSVRFTGIQVVLAEYDAGTTLPIQSIPTSPPSQERNQTFVLHNQAAVPKMAQKWLRILSSLITVSFDIDQILFPIGDSTIRLSHFQTRIRCASSTGYLAAELKTSNFSIELYNDTIDESAIKVDITALAFSISLRRIEVAQSAYYALNRVDFRMEGIKVTNNVNAFLPLVPQLTQLANTLDLDQPSVSFSSSVAVDVSLYVKTIDFNFLLDAQGKLTYSFCGRAIQFLFSITPHAFSFSSKLRIFAKAKSNKTQNQSVTLFHLPKLEIDFVQRHGSQACHTLSVTADAANVYFFRSVFDETLAYCITASKMIEALPLVSPSQPSAPKSSLHLPNFKTTFLIKQVLIDLMMDSTVISANPLLTIMLQKIQVRSSPSFDMNTVSIAAVLFRSLMLDVVDKTLFQEPFISISQLHTVYIPKDSGVTVDAENLDLKWEPVLLQLGPPFLSLIFEALASVNQSFPEQQHQLAAAPLQGPDFVVVVEFKSIQVSFTYMLELGHTPNKVCALRHMCKKGVIRIQAEPDQHVIWTCDFYDTVCYRQDFAFLYVDWIQMSGCDIASTHPKRFHTISNGIRASYDPTFQLHLFKMVKDNVAAAINLKQRIWQIVWPQFLHSDQTEPNIPPKMFPSQIWDHHPSAIKEYFQWLQIDRKKYLVEQFMHVDLELRNILVDVVLSDTVSMCVSCECLSSDFIPHTWRITSLGIDINGSPFASMELFDMKRRGDTAEYVLSRPDYSENRWNLNEFADMEMYMREIHIGIPHEMDIPRVLYDTTSAVEAMITEIQRLPTFDTLSKRLGGPGYSGPPSIPMAGVTLSMHDVSFHLLDETMESWLQTVIPIRIEEKAREQSLSELTFLKLSRQLGNGDIDDETLDTIQQRLHQMAFASYAARVRATESSTLQKQYGALRSGSDSLKTSRFSNESLLTAHIDSIDVSQYMCGSNGCMYNEEDRLSFIKSQDSRNTQGPCSKSEARAYSFTDSTRDNMKAFDGTVGSFAFSGGAYMNTALSGLTVRVRRYDIDVLRIEDPMRISGCICIAQDDVPMNAFRTYTTTLGTAQKGDAPILSTIVSSPAASKLFYELKVESDAVVVSYGLFLRFALRDILARCVRGFLMGLVPPNETEPLQVWDYMRYLAHGQCDVRIQEVMMNVFLSNDSTELDDVFETRIYELETHLHHDFLLTSMREIQVCYLSQRHPMQPCLASITNLELHFWMDFESSLTDCRNHFVFHSTPCLSSDAYKSFKTEDVRILTAVSILSIDVSINQVVMLSLIKSVKVIRSLAKVPFTRKKGVLAKFSDKAQQFTSLIRDVQLSEMVLSSFSLNLWHTSNQNVHADQSITLWLDHFFCCSSISRSNSLSSTEHAHIENPHRIPVQRGWYISKSSMTSKQIRLVLRENDLWHSKTSRKLQKLLHDIEEGRIVVCCTYENQRSYPHRGWSSSMLPTDRHNWSDRKGGTYLPKSHDMFRLPAEWRWIGEWEVDHLFRKPGETDEDGWEYAIDFGNRYIGKSTWYVSVRRRCWVRLRERKADAYHAPLMKQDTIEDDETMITSLSNLSIHQTRESEMESYWMPNTHTRQFHELNDHIESQLNRRVSVHRPSDLDEDGQKPKKNIEEMFQHFDIVEGGSPISPTDSLLKDDADSGSIVMRSSTSAFNGTLSDLEDGPDHDSCPSKEMSENYKLYIKIPTVYTVITLDIRNSIHVVVDAYMNVLRDHISNHHRRVMMKKWGQRTNVHDSEPLFDEDGDSEEEDNIDTAEVDQLYRRMKNVTHSDDPELIVSTFTAIENLISFEVLDPQLCIQSDKSKGRLVVYLGRCAGEGHILWTNAVEGSGESAKRSQLGISLHVEGVQAFVSPSDVEVNPSSIWLETHRLDTSRVLKPISGSIDVHMSGYYFIQDLRHSSVLTTEEMEHNILSVTIQHVHVYMNQEQFFLVSNTISHVFGESFPSSEDMEEELSTMLYQEQLEVDPFQLVHSLWSKRNVLLWKQHHLEWLLNSFLSTSEDVKDEMETLRTSLHDCKRELVEVQTELTGMITVCEYREKTEKRSLAHDFTDSMADQLDSVLLQLTVSKVLFDLRYRQKEDFFIRTDIDRFSIAITLCDFDMQGIAPLPHYVDLYAEISSLRVETDVNHEKYRVMLCPFDPTAEWDEKRVTLSFHMVMRDVAGVIVVPHLEINVAHLQANVMHRTIMNLIEFFTMPKKDIMSKRSILIPRGVGFLNMEKREYTFDQSADDIVASKGVRKKLLRKFRVKRKAVTYDKSDAVSQMKQRAKSYANFHHIRFGTVRITMSYKGGKQFNIEDIEGLKIRLKAKTYRDKSWTWAKFGQKLKRDYIKSIVAQVGENMGTFISFKLGLNPKDTGVSFAPTQTEDSQSKRESGRLLVRQSSSWRMRSNSPESRAEKKRERLEAKKRKSFVGRKASQFHPIQDEKEEDSEDEPELDRDLLQLLG